MATNKQKLIIVESPAKAKTISKYLGKGYKVEASQGHVCDLPKSQLGVDIDHDFDLKYITIRGRGDILSRIRKEAKNASQIYFATDPDREGEAISWHLFHVLGVDEKSPCRIEFNEVTKKAVQAAIKKPRKLDMGRIDAQQARRALDRLVGYKISPLLWVKVKKGLSAGRVQSVATRMVVEREREIDNFIPEEYWDITADCTVKGEKKPVSFSARFTTLDGQKKPVSNKAEAEEIRALIESGDFTVTDIKKKEKKRQPAPPFTTSSLQQEAGRKLSFTTAKTMQVVQQLYEGVDLQGEGAQGLVTYIRTDSVRISDDAMTALRAFIPEKYGKEYLPKEKNEFKGRKNAQDAHEAIRPTDVTRTPDSIKNSLSREQFMLYRLIYNRFVASQMAPAVYETLSAEITDQRVGLRFYGEHKIFAGFTTLYEEGTDESEDNVEMTLPALKEGQKISVKQINTDQHFTQPPSRYTEASLVRTLEENGIGRPSTYAPTITTIIARGYVSREKKRLFPTELGIMVTEMMEKYFTRIVDTEFTAFMEEKLDAVEEGQQDWKQILRDFYPDFISTLSVAEKEIEKVEVKDDVSDVPCDKCGAMMVYKMGRFGRFLACPNFPECRNTMPILTYIDAACPVCGKRLLEKTSKKNRKFYGCEGYPECDFVSWDKPANEKCPQCGHYMIEKRNNKGETIHLCTNENCRFKKVVTVSGEEDNE
ncbi:type I DNA topoisomerase [Aristaeella hokkaidonensis]|uniref:Type I DNA topoisomerase n=1 Tax=Aristaeella hokkaidonensis TaxID=3046382 RepID=A0AC61NBM0_9FIRM|nr:type I DNA topoisomerase [Aristaeella hokkaidonensis]QUC68006.1 type I DNA topoisomerase [Aristaeella hokkaidonensis]SNT93076.1 DNA topoisomerase I [Aristaeella hokkaidonensis]